MGNGGTCNDISAFSYRNGCNQIDVAAYKGIIFNGCHSFIITIIIDRYCTTTNIYVFPYLCIPNITKVRHFGAFINCSIFHFNKVTNFYVAT
ncbi:hypothetical protein D3C75_1070700 [compost metagenome]